jgi:hypothetical protein
VGGLLMKNITPFSISAPGFYGLNTSDAPVDLPPNFSLIAENCIIDKSGRVAARKGWTKATTTTAALGTADITCIGELIQNDGTATTLVTGNGKLFKLASGALTELTYGGGGVAPTISANNWHFSQLNGIAMFWQRGYDPLIYDPAVSTTAFRRLSEKSGSAGTVYQCNVALSAYGRVWAADTTTDKQTVVFSDLLTPHIWTGGTAGSLDLRQVWPSGGDEVVALAAHNDFLIIFGKWQTLVYRGAQDPATMELHDAIVGIGCIARDSVQNTGRDVIFLSDSGLQSISRTIQEKSAPLVQLSKNVNGDLQDLVNATTDLESIKSGYSAVNNFYILTMPAGMISYCFDTRLPLQDGSLRATTWSLMPEAFYETKGRNFYLGMPGYLGDHSGYLDDASTYRLSYFTTWIDFGNPVQISILKKILLTLIGVGSQSVTFKWAYDFSSSYFSQSATIAGAGTPAEYGIAEYNESEYFANVSVNVLSVNGTSSGRVLQMGFEAQINDASLSVQKIDIFTKDGNLRA